MPSLTRTLFTEVLTALREQHEHYDLRTTDETPRVVIGEYESPPISGVPFVALRLERGRSGYGVAAMGEYEVGGDLVVCAWVASDADDVSERALDAMDLASDCITALQDAHADGATYPTLNALPRMEAEDLEVYGDGASMPSGWGCAVFTCRFQAIVDRGI